MKILQINNVYDFGSTGKITADIHRDLLRLGVDSTVCYGRRQKVQEPQVQKVCGELESHIYHFLANLSGIMYGGCGPATRRLIRIIQQEKPDIVHLQCLNGYFVNIYQLVDWLKRHQIKTVLTLHAEFMYTANCGHALECEQWREGCQHCPRWKEETESYFWNRTTYSWNQMKAAFQGFEENLTVVSVSPWLRQRAEQSSMLRGFDHRVIYNGLDTQVFRPYPVDQLRKKHGLNHEKVIFHASPNFNADPSNIKGGCHVLELARRMQGEPVKFIVAGPYDEGVHPPENMILLGHINDRHLLAQYYTLADVTLLTSKKETFSMVCAESFCCGTPVVGFKAGAPELISLPEYSEFVEQGNTDQLEAALRRALSSPPDRTGIVRTAVDTYSSAKMSSAYIQLYHEILNDQK